MSASQALSASLEDYLEAIFRIVTEKRVARSRDIAGRLAVKRSSVTGALRSLAERELVNYAPYDTVTLTDTGREAALDVVRRHDALRDFVLNILGVEADAAEEAACRLEHAIPRDVLARLIEFVEFIRACPRAGPAWIEHFRQSCVGASDGGDCGACVAQCLSAPECGAVGAGSVPRPTSCPGGGE